MLVLCTTTMLQTGLVRVVPLLLERQSVVVNRLCRVTSIKGFDFWRDVVYDGFVKAGRESRLHQLCGLTRSQCVSRKLTWLSGTASFSLIYRVRQREYNRTVGRKTLWKPPFSKSVHTLSQMTLNDCANEIQDSMERSLFALMYHRSHKWHSPVTTTVE
jgi:hypothetical protein